MQRTVRPVLQVLLLTAHSAQRVSSPTQLLQPAIVSVLLSSTLKARPERVSLVTLRAWSALTLAPLTALPAIQETQSNQMAHASSVLLESTITVVIRSANLAMPYAPSALLLLMETVRPVIKMPL